MCTHMGGTSAMSAASNPVITFSLDEFPSTDEHGAKYNSYSAKMLAKIRERAQDLLQRGVTLTEYLNSVDLFSYGLEKANLLEAFMNNPELTAEEQVFFRIGEPAVNGGADQYAPSTNFAEQKAEAGVSVVTPSWLHSLKSVFFGAHDDDKLAARGVYAIKGVVIGYGGDGEPLIYPTAWAKKTKIKTYDALEKAVSKTK